MRGEERGGLLRDLVEHLGEEQLRLARVQAVGLRPKVADEAAHRRHVVVGLAARGVRGALRLQRSGEEMGGGDGRREERGEMRDKRMDERREERERHRWERRDSGVRGAQPPAARAPLCSRAARAAGAPAIAHWAREGHNTHGAYAPTGGGYKHVQLAHAPCRAPSARSGSTARPIAARAAPPPTRAPPGSRRRPSRRRRRRRAARRRGRRAPRAAPEEMEAMGGEMRGEGRRGEGKERVPRAAPRAASARATRRGPTRRTGRARRSWASARSAQTAATQRQGGEAGRAGHRRGTGRAQTGHGRGKRGTLGGEAW